MTESFLHYIWEFQYFDKTDLRTTVGEELNIFQQGSRNAHAGPDFQNGRVRIGNIDWVGHIELHIFSSAWIEHGHSDDRAYDNVILHVVWAEDKKIVQRDGVEIPTLELKGRIAPDLLERYKKLVNTIEPIPCAKSIRLVRGITVLSMLDKAMMHRLEHKAKEVLSILKRNGDDWEETAYQLLCRNFGFKVNADAFQRLAVALPYRILLKHSDKLLQVEAMLFGQAGFLDSRHGDEYYQSLRREHKFLSAKFSLAQFRVSTSQWKFLRLRPANFPTLRLAQLAALLFLEKNLFSKLMELRDKKAFLELFAVEPSPYWKHHYHFRKEIEGDVASLGEMSAINIVINTVVPLLVAYGKARDEQRYIDRAVDVLQSLAPEDNAIIKQWTKLGVKASNAGEAQGLIELHNNFCLKRRCLDCNIGFTLLEQGKG